MVADVKLDNSLILALGHPARAICLADGGNGCKTLPNQRPEIGIHCLTIRQRRTALSTYAENTAFDMTLVNAAKVTDDALSRGLRGLYNRAMNPSMICQDY